MSAISFKRSMSSQLLCLALFISSLANGETIFGPEDVHKEIETSSYNSQTITFSHDFKNYCNQNNINQKAYEQFCKHPPRDSILATLSSADTKIRKNIDAYIEDGASPNITNLISINLDADDKIEIVIQVFNAHRHYDSYASGNIIETFIYKDTAPTTNQDNMQLKRLFYLEEELAEAIKGKDPESYFSREKLVSALQNISTNKLSASDLNKKGEHWYGLKSKHPNSSPSWHSKRLSYGYNIAISYFEAAVEKDSDFLPALSNLGIAYIKVGNPERAIQFSKKVILLTQKPHQLAAAFYNIGKAYEELQQWQPALDAYENARKNRKHTAYSNKIKLIQGKLGVKHQPSYESIDDCPSNTYQYSNCITEIYNTKKLILDEKLKNLSSISEIDEKSLLKATNKNWELYIDNQCKLENYENRSTTGWQSYIAMCKLKNTEIRIKEISKIIKFKELNKELL